MAAIEELISLRNTRSCTQSGRFFKKIYVIICIIPNCYSKILYILYKVSGKKKVYRKELIIIPKYSIFKYLEFNL